LKLAKLARIVLLVVFVAVLAAGVGFFWLRNTGLPLRAGRVALFELATPVTVRFDAWAVPHVEAGTGRDLAMAMGWLHANERMTQMELGRRAAFGRLSEVLGSATIAADREALELRLGATAEELVDALSVEHRGLLEAYALGVNSWLERSPNGLPPELVVLNIEPRPWRIADSLSFMLLLSRDLSYPRHFEELRWTWLARAGAQRLREISGGDLALDPEIERYVREHSQSPNAPVAQPKDEAREVKNGSNSWALGASRTKNEAPLVANDPHLGLGVPSLWDQALVEFLGEGAPSVSY
jgi:penicillin amidase